MPFRVMHGSTQAVRDQTDVELAPFGDSPAPLLQVLTISGTCFEPVIADCYAVADARRLIRPGDLFHLEYIPDIPGAPVSENGRMNVVKQFLKYDQAHILTQNAHREICVPLAAMTKCRRISFVSRSRVTCLLVQFILRTWPTFGDERMRRLARRVLAHRAKIESQAGKKPSAAGIVVMQPRSILR